MVLYANYHTHTWHCGHAVGTPREYIESAIEEGTQVLGFTDHAPYWYPNGYVSPLRMTQDKAEDYFRTELGKHFVGRGGAHHE